jgi:ferrochelatase
MQAVARHYERFGGVSPLNAANRALVAAVQAELDAHGPSMPVYWGNRNWHPFLADTLRRMGGDGIRRALALVTSAYSSYSGCRQYLEDIARAREEAGPAAPAVDKLRGFYNHPRWIEANACRVAEALDRLPVDRRDRAPLVFTAHSLPVAMAAGCDYEAELRETCGLVAGAVGRGPWTLAWQSRSGPPGQPWLEPDVGDHLAALATRGARDVVVAPVGFVSDHMEVVYDLDTEARARADALGLAMVRAGTAGSHPAFVRMVRELVAERLDPAAPRPVLGTRGPRPDTCPPGCCPPGPVDRPLAAPP